MSTTISVIIPSKNRPELVSEAIMSVLNQNLPDDTKLELIVIDAYSKKSLKNTIGKNFPKVKIIKSQGYNSPGGTRNYGLKLATGKYISFLDNDDQWHSNFIKESLSLIQSTKAPATVCLTSPHFNQPYPFKKRLTLLFLNLVRSSSFYIISLLHSKRLPRSGFYLCQISHMLFNSKKIKGIKFNEKSVAAEDWEYFANATIKDTIAIVLKPLVKFRYILSSNTNTPEVVQKKWIAYQDLLNRLPVTHTKGLLNSLFNLYIKSFS